MAYLDLGKNGPMVVEVSASPFLGSILDLWQVPLSGIDSNGGTFVIATEDYEGEIKVPKGAKLLRSRTSVAVFFARGLVIDGDMTSAVSAVTDSRIYPLSKHKSPSKQKVWKASGVTLETLSPMNPMEYWQRLAKVMNFLNPEIDQDASLLKPLGIEPGKPFKPNARQKQILADAAHFGWVMELDPSLQEAFWRNLEERTNYYFQATMAQPAMKTKAVGRVGLNMFVLLVTLKVNGLMAATPTV